MKAVILHQTIAKHDAIGNDIFGMYEILSRKHEAFVYCDSLFNDKLPAINRRRFLDIISNKNNLVIYHHSVYWEEGEELLNQAKAKVIIKYHNITPETFFKPYDAYYPVCQKGRQQTQRIYQNHADFFWMGDSLFNLNDAGIKGNSNTTVVPPFNNLQQWQRIVPDESQLKELMESSNVNLLFVGRIVPSKGHRFLIKVIKDYAVHYSKDISLFIVGKQDDALMYYHMEIETLISQEGLQNNIILVGEISDSRLLSFYLGCDFYLNCSDHEGFCVPIIEAQSLKLPVISKNSSAVPETIGAEQLMLNNDPRAYSAAIHVLAGNEICRDYLIEKGYANYHDRFTNQAIEAHFIKTVEEFAGVIL